MEILNLFNNALEEVPVSISGMPKLRLNHRHLITYIWVEPDNLHVQKAGGFY
jgi:hypothetical protein